MQNRRNLLKASAVLAGGAVSGFPFIARAQSARILRFSHTDTSVGAAHDAATRFAEAVEKYTSGRCKVQVFHSGQLANDAKSLDQLQLGGLDFALTGVVTFTPHVKDLSLIALPYLAENYEQGWKLYDTSKFIKQQADLLPAKGMRIIGNWEAGFRSFTTNFPLNSPADAKGRKLRIAPVEMIRWIMESIGFSPVVMPVTEVYLAIQQNTVSGQENPIDTIFSQRFYEVAKHVTLSQHVYSPRWLAMAERTFKGLSPADQEGVLKAAKEAGDWNRREVRANDDRLLAEMTAKGATIAKPDLALWRKASEGAYERARKEFGAAAVDQMLGEAAEIRKSMS
ncbi:TRAP transporter substrate-binding protein [Bosea rubneri]|uniref:TRAP transporter substrate-binding protein n=1 Tax=Bosea rubneri TaxID=3075434 RepID=A0ABU3S959_9HYPH|nr:TRAP transporter substrate-binding protein [Bosea sp. ZW T0_25]MDU0341312.1 TRAP transporter substrate-binding protein [Bosea sp. ZW T0_25]